MTVYLLANVGLRDVLHRREPISPPRAEGKRILDYIDDLEKELTLPMLSPAVEGLLRDHPKIQVVLYGSDQPEGTPPQYRDNDTIYLAEVAGELLQRRLRGKIEKVWPKKIRANPSLYDDMLSFFRAQFQDRWTSSVEKCYVFPVGGTPAANMGMMLAAIERFGEKCQVLYLPQGEKWPIRMDLGDQIRRGTARRMAADRLRAHSFGAAVPLLEEAGAPGWVAHLARYAVSRYHFDFDIAAAELEKAKRHCSDQFSARSRCEELRRGLPRLRDRELEALLVELYHNAQLAYKRGEFAAFLGILFRFQEATLRFMVEKLYPGLSTEVGSEDDGQEFEARLRQREGLFRYLQRLTVKKGRPLRLCEPSRPVLGAMVRYAWEGEEKLANEERVEQFRRTNEILAKFDRLAGLRNKCIIAHGFEGVSEKRIMEEYAKGGGTGEPLQDMAAALEALGIPRGDDPFEEVAKLALEGLSQP